MPSQNSEQSFIWSMLVFVSRAVIHKRHAGPFCSTVIYVLWYHNNSHSYDLCQSIFQSNHSYDYIKPYMKIFTLFKLASSRTLLVVAFFGYDGCIIIGRRCSLRASTWSQLCFRVHVCVSNSSTSPDLWSECFDHLTFGPKVQLSSVFSPNMQNLHNMTHNTYILIKKMQWHMMKKWHLNS